MLFVPPTLQYPKFHWQNYTISVLINSCFFSKQIIWLLPNIYFNYQIKSYIFQFLFNRIANNSYVISKLKWKNLCMVSFSTNLHNFQPIQSKKGTPQQIVQKVVKSTYNNFATMKNNKIMVFEYLDFAKRCSFFPSQLGCFSFSSQLGTEKEHLLRKLKY